jgi:anti-sigma B factor antagonist
VKPVKIEVRKHGDICIIDISGELAFGNSIDTLRGKSRELVAAGETLFLFNMEGVPWLDSSGIGEIVACHKRARERRGVVKLVLSEKSRSLFTITNLEKMFDIFSSVDEALASFQGPEGGYRERF